MQKSTISRIYARARSPEIPPQARAALFAELRALQGLQSSLRPRKTAKSAQNQHAQTGPKRVKKPPKQPITTCKLCKRPWPHRKGPEGRYHMLAVKRRWMQQASQRHFRAVGYDKFWGPSAPARRARALTRRTAIFKEMAPHAAAILGDDAIRKLADSRRFGVTRYLVSLERWRQFVRIHYIASRSVRDGPAAQM